MRPAVLLPHNTNFFNQTNMINNKLLILAFITAIGLCVESAHGQGFSFYGQNSRGFDGATPVSITTSKDIGKNVYAIDNLADQMAFRLGWEMKFSKDSDATIALYKQMKKHAGLTNELIKAYRGKGSTSFRQAAFAVNNSLELLQRLRREAKTSDTVSNYITQSIPLVSFVNNNAANFVPTKG